MDSFSYSIFLSFFKNLTLYIKAVYPAIMEAFGGFALAFVTLYIVIVGVLILLAKFSKEKTIEFGISMVLIGALAVLFETNAYFYWIVTPTVKLIMDLASFFIGIVTTTHWGSGSGIEALFNNLDALSFKIFDLVFNLDPPGGLIRNTGAYVKTGFLAVVLLGCFAAAYVAFLVQIILGFFSLYVLFIVGGICIFFASFSQTRFIFWAWLKALINYSLLIVFTSIIMSICFFGLSQSIDKLILLKGAAGLFSREYLITICWAVLTFGVLRKGADYASELSGGQAGSTSNIVGGIGAAAGAGASFMGLNAITGGGGVSGMDGKGLIQGVGGKVRQGLAAVGNRAYSNMKGIDTK